MEDMAKAIREAVQRAIENAPRKEYVLLCNIEEYDMVTEATNNIDIMVIGYQMIEKGTVCIMERSKWAEVTIC